jgi:hypothetical protein
MLGSYELRGDGLPGVLRCAHCKVGIGDDALGVVEVIPKLDDPEPAQPPAGLLPHPSSSSSAATTKKGLCVRAERDREWNPTGVKVAHQVDC